MRNIFPRLLQETVFWNKTFLHNLFLLLKFMSYLELHIERGS